MNEQTLPESSSAVLPLLTREQIENKLVRLLQKVGDLSVYIERVDEDGTIVVKNMKLDGEGNCSVVPRPTLANTALREWRLILVRDAIRAANTSFARGESLRVEVSEARP